MGVRRAADQSSLRSSGAMHSSSASSAQTQSLSAAAAAASGPSAVLAVPHSGGNIYRDS